MNNEYTQVFDIYGEPKELGKFVNSGGEGNVYRLKEKPELLIKIYNSSERANRQKEKIIAMKNMDVLKKNKQLAWPQLAIYDVYGNFIGFAMWEKKGFSLNQLGIPQLVKEKLPHWNRQNLLKAALSFIDCMEELHSNNIIIGDINPGNFLIDPHTSEVSFIDCDSYQVKKENQTFFCEVGIQQFMAPEFIGCNMKTTIRTKTQDTFSAAMILYRLFMFGSHPYNRINGKDPVSNLKSGKCPLGIGSGYQFPCGPWYNYWSHLPYKIKTLFISMFRNGHKTPCLRPTLENFKVALTAYSTGIDKGLHCNQLMPTHAKDSSYKENSQKIA